jgi:hypothetical protein
MVTWEVWKHRNACVFEGAQPSFSCSSRQCLMSVFFGAWQELPSSRSSLLGHCPGHLMSSRCGHGLFLCKSQPSGVSCTDYRGCLTSVLIPFFFPKWNDAQSSCTVWKKKNIPSPIFSHNHNRPHHMSWSWIWLLLIFIVSVAKCNNLIKFDGGSAKRA